MPSAALVGLITVNVQVSCIQTTTVQTVPDPCSEPQHHGPASGEPYLAPGGSSREPTMNGGGKKQHCAIKRACSGRNLIGLFAQSPSRLQLAGLKERLGADKQRRPADNGLTKQSGPSTSTPFGRSSYAASKIDRNRSPKTRIPRLRPASLNPDEHHRLFVIENPAACVSWCHSGGRVLCPLRRVAKFRFDTRCQTDPVVLPQFPAWYNIRPPARYFSLLFFFPPPYHSAVAFIPAPN